MSESVLNVQIMLTPPLLSRAEQLARLLVSVRPDEVQLNLPTRPVPHDWDLSARDNAGQAVPRARRLRAVGRDAALGFESELGARMGLAIRSRYGRDSGS